MEWVTLLTAPDQLTAELWQGMLMGEGIPAMVEPPVGSFLGLSPFPCRLKVPDSLVEEARALLAEYGAAQRGGPETTTNGDKV